MPVAIKSVSVQFQLISPIDLASRISIGSKKVAHAINFAIFIKQEIECLEMLENC